MTEKFISPAPPPTPHERELTEILIEECAEIIREAVDVQQRATKLLRFGPAEIQPGQEFSNTHRLAVELGDLQAVVLRMIDTGLISSGVIESSVKAKGVRLDRYMQTSDSEAPK